MRKDFLDSLSDTFEILYFVVRITVVALLVYGVFFFF